MILLAGTLFFYACAHLNRLTLQLAPLALFLTLVYSLTKRFTWLCHLVLGIALACSPLGGWVAVRGSLLGYPFWLSLGVLFWVAGFDAVYACLDADFDQGQGLFSLPARFGRRAAFRLAALAHLLAFVCFTATGLATGLGIAYYLGLAFTGAAMVYQHYVVSPTDLSRIQLSFFTMNGMISLTLFVATWLALVL
jgi:4-hydroxybenzoate polyprenyltransferase